MVYDSVTSPAETNSDNTATATPDWEALLKKPLAFSTGANGYASVIRVDTTVGDFLLGLIRHRSYLRRADKKILPVFVPVVLKDYTVPPPVGDKKPKNLKNHNVAEITSLVGDLDNDDPSRPLQTPLEATAWLRSRGYAHAYSSTTSSSAEKPKARIGVPITQSIVLETQQDQDAYAIAYERFWTEAGVAFDPTCKDAAQYYVSPAVWCDDPQEAGREHAFGPYVPGAAHFAELVPGRAVDFHLYVEKAREDLRAGRVSVRRNRGSSPERGTRVGDGVQRPTERRITQDDLQTPGLFDFNARYRLDLDIEGFIEKYEPDGVRGEASGGGIHCRCPNQHGEVTGRPHSDERDSTTAFWARNPQDEQGYVLKCHTAGCTEHFAGDALRYLDALCVRFEIKDASELIPFSEAAQRGAAQREEARARHQEVWGAAEALGGDKEALGKAVDRFREGPCDDALNLILRALATLAETSVTVGGTIKTIKKAAHQPPALLRKAVQRLREEYLGSVADLEEAPDDAGRDRTPSPFFDPPVGAEAGLAPCVRGEWDHQDQVRVAKAMLERKNRELLRIYRGADGGYVRIVRKVVNKVEQYVIEDLSHDAWAHELGAMIEYRKVRLTEGDKGRALPEALVSEIRGDLSLDLPPLVRVTDVPLHSSSGTLRVEPGYDPDTETYLVPGFAIRMPPAVGSVTEADVREAERILLEGVRDFPFSDVFDGKELAPIYTDEIGADGHRVPNWQRGLGSRVNVFGCLIHCFTPNLRTGPSPSYHIDKPKMATGAGYLANFISIIRDGRRMVPTPLPKNEEEIEKRITSLRLAGNTFIMWDNIRIKVESESLALYETGDTYQGRKLGESSSPIFPTDVPMIYTTNNGSFTSEHYRRKVPIRLDASKAKPRERTGFKYQPYAEKMLAMRADFVWAIHTLINNWIQLGRPGPQNVPHFATYPEWVAVVGGVLEAAGIFGLLSNMAAYLSGKDDDDDGENDLIERINDRFGKSAFTAREVYDAFRSSFTQKWEVDSVPLDLQNEAKAIRQLSEHIGQNLEGGTFEIDRRELKLVQANNRSPKQWCLVALEH